MEKEKKYDSLNHKRKSTKKLLSLMISAGIFSFT